MFIAVSVVIDPPLQVEIRFYFSTAPSGRNINQTESTFLKLLQRPSLEQTVKYDLPHNGKPFPSKMFEIKLQ